MNILVNGIPTDLPDDITIAEALKHLDYRQQHLAVAINQEFVPRNQRERNLQPGDQLEIVAPMQGG